MSAVRARLRADLQTRWWSWAALALIIGVAGAIVLTAATGARRTGTAYERFLVQSHAEDVYIAGPSPVRAPDASLERDIERLPQVAAASPIAAMVMLPLDRSVPAPYHFAGSDSRYGTTIDRPNVVAGRRPRPDQPQEVMINRAMARAKHLQVGSTTDWVLFTTKQANSPGFDLESHGTPVHLRVVGIGVYPNEVVPTAPYDSSPFLYLTPAFYRAHTTNTQEYGFEVVRLRRGQADVTAFRAGLDKVLKRHGGDEHQILFADRAERNASVRRAIQPQAIALALFAALAGVAFLLVIGQVLARRTFLDATDNATLHALGMTRAQLLAASLIKVAAIASAGAVLAVVAAALASPLMPIGPARLAEPHPGVAVNVAMLGFGFSAIVVLLLLVAVLPSWRAANVRSDLSGVGRVDYQRRSRVVEALAGTGVPATLLIGVRAALQPGSGRTRVPVRSTLVVGGLAIAMVAVSFTFTSNLNRLVQSPHRYGWSWDLKAGDGFFAFNTTSVLGRLRSDPDVRAVSGANYGEAHISDRSVPAVGIDPLQGVVFPTLLEGRPVAADDEIVLGSSTLRHIHRSVGDTVRVAIDGPPKRMRIVGRAVFPKLGAGSFRPTNLGDGAVVTAEHFVDPESPNDKYSVVLIRLRPGADLAVNRARLTVALKQFEFCGGDVGCVSPAEPPGDISNYARIRGTTLALAAALAVMAIGALGHGLITSVRRRRRDLALLKTIGFTRSQVSATTAWQATVTAVVALVVGLPLGVGSGRVIWRTFAGQIGVDPSPGTPLSALLLAIPATIVLANVIAAVPALIAARTAPAAVLRSE